MKAKTMQSLPSFLSGRMLLLVAAVVLMLGSVASATTLEYDTSATAGYQGGNAVWDASTTSVWTASGGAGTTLSTWSGGTDAVFASTLTGGTSTLTVNSAISLDSILIQSTSANAPTINAGTGAITINTGGNVTISGAGVATFGANVLTGSGGLILNSTGGASTTNAETFTGQVQIVKGNLTVTSLKDFGNASGLGNGTVGTPVILGTVGDNVNSGGLWLATDASVYATNRTFQLASGGYGAIGFGGSVKSTTLNGVISGGNSTSLMQFAAANTGTLGAVMVFGVQNTYSGATRIYGTTDANGLNWAKIGVNDALPTGTTLGLGYTSGTYFGLLDLGGYNQTLAGLARSTGSTAAATSLSVFNTNATLSTLTLNIASGINTYDGMIGKTSGNNLALAKTGAGTLTLLNASTYTGGTSLTAGTMVLSNNSAAGTAGIVMSGASSSTLQIDSAVTIANNITFSNTNAASSVNRLVANTAAYTVGTSGSLMSNFSGGKPDTSASILAGTNSQGSTATLIMKFSDTSSASNDGIRKSDVFSLSGTSTNTFVLQLNVTGVAAGNFLAWVNGSGSWANAVTGNTGNNASGAQQGYAGSFSTFQGTYGSTLSAYVGAYGVDTTGGSVWAVINHNSDYAVVPEPATWALLAFSLTTVMVLRRRRQN